MNLKIFIVKMALASNVALLFGCSKLVEVEVPVTYVTGESVYNTRETAIAQVTGIYTKMSEGALTASSFNALTLIPGLSADEFSLLPGQTNQVLQDFYRNQASAQTGSVAFHFWYILYSYIYMSNAAVEGLTSSSGLDKITHDQLLGEALFLRALNYFYLVNLYGDVPLLLTTDYKINSVASRTPQDAVWNQIIKDLLDARSYLADKYLESDLVTSTAGTIRVRPSKMAATALLARAYLYRKNYAMAESESLSLINSSSNYSLATLGNVFKSNNAINKESIWQLQPVVAGRNTQDAWLFILPSSGPTENNANYPVFLSDTLLKSFEPGDQRRLQWIKTITVQGKNYSHPFKYQVATLNAAVTEHSIVFRLAEQYLIGAEARARQGNIKGADTLLNAVRSRAGLTATASQSQDAAVASILHEKQVELFSEWGHRWLDLKRAGMVDQVMAGITPLKSGESWRSFQQLYPIPQTDMQYNPGLAGQQNNGY